VVLAEHLDIRELATVAEFDSVVSMFCKVWSANTPVDLINASTLRALSMSDNYVVGAYLDGEMVGGTIAWRGKDHVHSHLTGVLPGLQGQGLGGALKAHQLQWALERDLPTIRWTYDPLVRRNAHFNLWKLGATVLAFEENLYGRLEDGINDGEDTDRLVVEWTDGLSKTKPHEPPAAELLGRDIPTGFESRVADELRASLLSEDGKVLLVATPEDIEDMRLLEHKRALLWRIAVREAFRWADANDFRVTGITSDGWYVLRP
jgi:predicted GNAT superfamily acetyltransferase